MIPGILIRPVTSADRAALAFSLGHLGERSRYQRFLGGSPTLVDDEVQRLRQVDHWHHEVLLAWSLAPRAPIGITEYVRLGEFDVAELAVSVVDGWQRTGVGRSLVLALRARARAAGIRRFTATMLRGNRGALALARELGRCRTLASAGRLVDVAIEL